MIQAELEELAKYSYDQGTSDMKNAIVMAINQFAEIASRFGKKSEYRIYKDLATSIDTIEITGYLDKPIVGE